MHHEMRGASLQIHHRVVGRLLRDEEEDLSRSLCDAVCGSILVLNLGPSAPEFPIFRR
jgi:hypothetical protein